MLEINELRKTVLSVIEKNCKIDLKELAVLLGESEVEIANAIADMEKENIICGYHTMINWENTTEDKVTAMIEVMVTPQKELGFDKIAERIYNFSEVQSLYLMSGGFDFMIILEEKTMKSVSHFIAEKLSPIEAIRGTATHFVLKKYKEHGTVLNVEKEDERILMTP